MANKTITQLPLDNILSGVEEIPLFQSGKTSKTNLQAIAEFVKNSISGGTPDTPGGSSLIISATPPLNPKAGDVWIDDFIRYTYQDNKWIEI